ncbi:MAG: hypothetical protein IID37_02360, partial [Planctomycetes bacterium]|nr:hypothetical protein [Planctomycetota bacterium]
MSKGFLLMKAGTCVTMFVLVGGILTPVAYSQDRPFNAELVGHWDEFDGSYADVWAEGDYAYLAERGSAGVLILDISDPTTPVLVAEYLVHPQNDSSSAQDVKVGDDLLFVALEGNDGPTRVEIVDVRDPTTPELVGRVDTEAIGTPHNLFYDRGYLYIVDSSSQEIAIVDLTDFDPDDPPSKPITELKWLVSDVGASLVHDITVRPRPTGETWLYASAWNSGLFVFDVTNVADEPPVFLASVDGSSTHSCWPTEDGKFVITGEEREGGGITVFEIVEEDGAVSLQFRDAVSVPQEDSFSVHNQFCVRNRVYNSWYNAGMRAYDVDPATGGLTLVSSFDARGIYCAWGIFPLPGSDRVLLSDIDTGLWVIADLAPTTICYADANGDGVQALADFTAIQLNFLTVGDAADACPGGASFTGDRLGESLVAVRLTPRTVVRLESLGLPEAHRADLNNDGWIDSTDIRLF